MKEVFEHAYEGFCNSIVRYINLCETLGKFVLVILVYITIPFWIIPYAIYKNKKGGD